MVAIMDKVNHMQAHFDKCNDMNDITDIDDKKLQIVDVMTLSVCQPGCPLQDLVLLLEKQVYALEARCFQQQKEIEMLVTELERNPRDAVTSCIHTMNSLSENSCSQPLRQSMDFEIKEECLSDDEASLPQPSSSPSTPDNVGRDDPASPEANSRVENQEPQTISSTTGNEVLPTSIQTGQPTFTYQCTHSGCKYGSNDKYKFNRHRSRKHGPKSPRFSCPHRDCAYVTHTSGALKDHEARMHGTARPFACGHPGCDSRFALESDMRVHRRTVHSTNKRVCPYAGCFYRSGNRSNFSQHVRRHRERHQERLCSHPGCQHRARDDAHLQRHVALVHSGARRPHVCPHEACGFVGATAKDLRKHLMTRRHNVEKPFGCPVADCSYRAAIRCYVTAHVRRCHSFEHFLPCVRSGCGYLALNRDELRQHMEAKHHIQVRVVSCPS